MKNALRIFFLFYLTITSFTLYCLQPIARGWQPGEVFFIATPGPGILNRALYYSTDYGQTMSIANLNEDFYQIACDKTPGYLYYTHDLSSSQIHISMDYGVSWTLGDPNGYSGQLISGIMDGWVFRRIKYHSEDYGMLFTQHNCNWFLNENNVATAELDTDSIHGYVLYNNWITNENFLGITINHFDSLITTYDYDTSPWNNYGFSRGANSGEIFILRARSGKYEIVFSDNYGETFGVTNNINVTDAELGYSTTGNSAGEIYIWMEHISWAYSNYQIFIFHSTDYGRTFEVFNPHGWGEKPVISNFSAPQTQGIAPFTVQWCNYSVGDDLSYEWDFDNDGIIDSNEEKPVHTYNEPGIYSVNLLVAGNSSNNFLRQDYIHVYADPPQPQNLETEVIGNDVYLVWQQVADTNLVGYNIYRDAELLNQQPVTDTVFQDFDLPNGSYEYCVSAVYPYGESQQSCVQADITVGIEDYQADVLRIVTSLACGQIGIVYPGAFELRIFDISGKEIYSKTNCWNRKNVFSGNLKRGVYVFVLDDGVKRISRKVALF